MNNKVLLGLTVLFALFISATAFGQGQLPTDQNSPWITFQPSPAKYVFIGDLNQLGDPVVTNLPLVTPQRIFQTAERDQADGTVTLGTNWRYMVNGSTVSIYTVNDSIYSIFSQAGQKPYIDLPEKVFMVFNLLIAQKPNPTTSDEVKAFTFSAFGGIIQSDRNEKPGRETFRFLSIGGILGQPMPLVFDACAYVVDTITQNPIYDYICTSYQSNLTAVCSSWDDIVHPTNSSNPYLDQPAYGWNDNYYWGNWVGGQCPKTLPSGAVDCSSSKIDPLPGGCKDYAHDCGWHHKFEYDNKTYGQVGWNWCDNFTMSDNPICIAYSPNNIIGYYATYTWKENCVQSDGSVQVVDVGNTYIEANGRGVIAYNKTPFKLVWNPTCHFNGVIRGIVPGDYSFTIPFATEGAKLIQQDEN
ncbi:MAG: hypothetical protein Q8898_16620 [Bacillota bacterium]|nr:hypothetical protein [Bacillota bacterium]